MHKYVTDSEILYTYVIRAFLVEFQIDSLLKFRAIPREKHATSINDWLQVPVSPAGRREYWKSDGKDSYLERSKH